VRSGLKIVMGGAGGGSRGRFVSSGAKPLSMLLERKMVGVLRGRWRGRGLWWSLGGAGAGAGLSWVGLVGEYGDEDMVFIIGYL
jgi:hypothetical protein